MNPSQQKFKSNQKEASFIGSGAFAEEPAAGNFAMYFVQGIDSRAVIVATGPCFVNLAERGIP